MASCAVRTRVQVAAADPLVLVRAVARVVAVDSRAVPEARAARVARAHRAEALAERVGQAVPLLVVSARLQG